MLLRGGARAPDEAEACFDRAIASARELEAKVLELRAIAALYRHLGGRGGENRALPMLAACYDWFTEGFDTVDLKEAKAILDENQPSNR